jgi:hypothetical protein
MNTALHPGSCAPAREDLEAWWQAHKDFGSSSRARRVVATKLIQGPEQHLALQAKRRVRGDVLHDRRLAHPRTRRDHIQPAAMQPVEHRVRAKLYRK